MDNSFEHYDLLSGLFAYPQPGFQKTVKDIQLFLEEYYPDAAAIMKIFAEFIATASQEVLEELYNRSFEVQAATTLDLGYALFGDDYKRGAVLVNLNSEHKEAGNDCGSELADHLPNVMRLLSKMEKPDFRVELVQRIIAPALRKITNEFDPSILQKKNKVYKKHHRTLIERSEEYGLIYQYPLKAVYKVFETDFDIKEAGAPKQSSDFLRSVGSELKIEPQ